MWYYREFWNTNSGSQWKMLSVDMLWFIGLRRSLRGRPNHNSEYVQFWMTVMKIMTHRRSHFCLKLNLYIINNCFSDVSMRCQNWVEERTGKLTFENAIFTRSKQFYSNDLKRFEKMQVYRWPMSSKITSNKFSKINEILK